MSRVNSIRFSLPYLQKKKKRAFGDLSWLHTYMNKSKFLHFELCWCPRGAWQEHFLWCLAAMQCFTKAYRGCRPLAVTFFYFLSSFEQHRPKSSYRLHGTMSWKLAKKERCIFAQLYFLWVHSCCKQFVPRNRAHSQRLHRRFAPPCFNHFISS